MAFKCKMLTKEKVKQWGCVGDDDCALYHRTVETRDRLFFDCDYAKNIWGVILISKKKWS